MRPAHLATRHVQARRAALLAGACVLAALAVPAPVRAQRATLERVTKQMVLDNGLQVIVVENHGVPLATLEVVVRNGSFTQEPQDDGVAHLFEHMLFRGYTGGSANASFAQEASELNAGFNGTTTEEAVTYYLTLPSHNLGDGLQILSRMMRDPRFREEDLARERQVVLGEYERKTSDPFYHLTSEVGTRLWGAGWSRKNTLGSPAPLNAATAARLETIYHRYYVPNNAALVITGDVTPAAAFDLARRNFADWKRAPDPFVAHPIPPIPPLAADTSVVVSADVNDVTLMVQWQGPSVRADPNATYAADVFSDVLNQPSSGFQKRLVDSGLFQSLGINYYTLGYVGPITISGQTTPDQLKAALTALKAEIARFGEPGYFSEEELANVKKARAVETAFGLERASGLAHTVAFWWSVAGLEYYMGYVDNMANRTSDDLRAYVRRYIEGKPKVFGALLAPDAARQIGPTVQAFLSTQAAP